MRAVYAIDATTYAQVTMAATLLGILSFLVALTIFFERTQEHMIHSSVPTMKPVVRQTFAEVTVLGFLSIVTTVAGKCGLWGLLAHVLYGEEVEEEELEELVETAHYTLFLVMIVFVLLVMGMVRVGNNLKRRWRALDKWCAAVADSNVPYPWLAGAPPPPSPNTPILGRLSKEEVIAYWGMRQEFLRDRSLLPPHADSKNKLPATFDYARYLMLSLSEDLVEMVDVDWPTWVVLEALAVAWCGVVAVNDGPFLLAAGWVAFEYAIFALALAFLNHVRRIARGTMDPAARDYIGGADARGEFTPIVGQDLPGWACAVDARIEEAERHHVRRLFCGHAPNKQHRLFLFEEKGHESHVFACRLLLLLQAVYVSLVVMTFAPRVCKHSSVPATGGYVLFALAPTVGIALVAREAVPLAIHCGSVGTFRNRKLVGQVLRETKASRAVKLLKTLYGLRAQIVTAPAAPGGPGQALSPRASATGVNEEDQRQLAQTFDLYDADGTGHLDADELSELLASLGMESSGAQAAAMLTGMDHDGDGQVSRSEFLSFMATQAETSENDQSIEHTAKKVFALFDNDGSGSVAHSEFTEGLRRFGISMTEEEMTILVEELDHDRDGSISLQEFTHLLKSVHEREHDVAQLH